VTATSARTGVIANSPGRGRNGTPQI
jgi:hypothetical protein